MIARMALVLGVSGVLLAAPARASEDAWQRIAISPAEAKVLKDWTSRLATAPAPGTRLSGGLVQTAAAVPAAPSLRRGDRIALDVYKSGRHVPPDVLAQLPDQPRGTLLMELDGQVVRVFRPTRTVVDVLR